MWKTEQMTVRSPILKWSLYPNIWTENCMEGNSVVAPAAPEITAALRSFLKQSSFKHRREWSEVGVSASKNHHTQMNKTWAANVTFHMSNHCRTNGKGLTWGELERSGLVLNDPKSYFQMKVNFSLQLEIEVPDEGSSQSSLNFH